MAVQFPTKGAYLTLSHSIFIFTDKDFSAAGLLGDPTAPNAVIITRGLLKLLQGLFFDASAMGKSLEIPAVAAEIKKLLNKDAYGDGLMVVTELVNRIHSFGITKKVPQLSAIDRRSNHADSEEFLNGRKFWIPQGAIQTRQVDGNAISLAVCPTSLAGDIEPDDSLNLVGITKYGHHMLLSSQGNRCAACAGCSGCGLCILCGEVNAAAAVANTIGVTATIGISN